MRITFILPGIGVSGGVRSTFEIADRLKARGHEVRVVYPLIGEPAGKEWKGPLRAAKMAWETFSNMVRGNKAAWFNLKADLVRVPTLDKRYIPDGDVIVATWWANAFDISSYPAEKGKKFYFIRGYETWGGPEDRVNLSYKLPLRLLATSSYLKRLIEGKFGVPVEGPLHNGVNFDIFYKERKDFSPHAPKRIGILYMNQACKGMDEGLAAVLKAKKEYGNAIELVLFGKKPLKKHIGMIEGIDKIDIRINPTQDELRRLYNSLDIFVYPSRYEGFGNPPMEAMACGAACVLTDVGAVKDYAQDGNTALISSPGDVSAMAANILRLLNDENMRRGIAEESCRAISKFTWDNSVEELERIFNGESA